MNIENYEGVVFDSFISLGGQCTTASSLSKFGLREFSGPFDWFTSSFKGVVDTLDEEFEFFLQPDNLLITEDNNRVFNDIKYDFNFNHDLKDSGLEKEFDKIKEKYDRRVKRFLEYSKKTTCYVRTINNQKEIEFITNNAERIKQVITKWNSKSIIVFIALRSHEIPENFPFPVFQSKVYRYYGQFREGLRSAFDTIPDFVDFCVAHYDRLKRIENKAFDIEREQEVPFSRIKTEKKAIEEINKADEAYYKSEQYHKDLEDKKLIERLLKSPDARVRNTMCVSLCNFSKIEIPDDGIDIYGAGWIGHFLYDMAGDKLNLGCFIDRKPDEKKPYYKDKPVVSIEEYIPSNGRTIVIVPTYDFIEIKEELMKKEHGKTLNCIGIDEFLKHGIPFDKRKELGI